MIKYKYKFSVIIPIYNVEKYLDETIESVIKQTIGFKENIQIILVNDDSPDNSEAICLKYQKEYPENIIYVKKENGGVSSARNKGLEYAEGEYINFLDSDDKWELDVFTKVYEMYKNHPEIDVIGVRQKYFEAFDNFPSLDFKFNKNKIVDIFNSYNHIQLSVTSGFIRKEAIGDIRFDTRIKYSEDAKFLTEIIIKKEKLGIIADSLHLYRRRLSENSAIQTKNKTDDWYLITPELCYKYVFELSKKKYGYVIPYIQYYVMYDYQWRAKEAIPNNISEQTKEKYFKITRELFKDIDDYIILEQKSIFKEYQINFLKYKYNRNILKELIYINHKLYFQGHMLINFNNRNLFKLNIMNINKETIELKGLINLYLPKEDYKIYAVINNERKELPIEDTDIYERKMFNEPFIHNRGFNIKIPNKNIKSIYFILEYKNKYETKLNFVSGVNAKIDTINKNYYLKDNKIYYFYDKKIKNKPATIKNKIWFSIRSLKYLIKHKKYKVIFIKLLYHIAKFLNYKKIWLITDRPTAANDNGYAFYKYCNENPNKKIKPIFAITKDSPDLKKVKKTGKYVIYDSLKYKIYFLLADKIISSQADSGTTNAFESEYVYYNNLYNADFIFLQHGIIKDDLSTWLNQYEKNIKIFVTSSEKEYNSIITGKYGYKEDVVKLTGLPRYDLLKNDTKKIITIMPTWRLKYANDIDKKSNIRKYFIGFKNTDYYNFYNNLINDKKLLAKMQEKGYKGIFVIHPSHLANSIDFKENNTFEVIKSNADYSKIFNYSSLLITDYSSVAFDFTYLNKPVLYTQYDKKDFFENHTYKEGYFSYENNGFGPVIYDYEKTVEEIIKFIENDCKIEKKYQERINKFYKYHDQNNCKRVYEEILKLKD